MVNPSLYILPFIPLANAWTFLYTNATDNATIFHQTGTQNCTAIDLAKGKEFSWDPENSNLCISIYYDDTCMNRGGISCPAWKKNSSNNFHGIQIFTNDDAASASISPAPTQTIFTSASLSSTSTSLTTGTSAAGTSAGSSTSSLSSGAIAGIAIGVVAAILLIGGLLFFIGRMNRKNATPESPAPKGPYKPTLADMQSAVPPHEFAMGTGNSEKMPPSSRGRPVPGSKVVELPGDYRTVELENSPVSEMDVHTADVKFNRF
ncbi:hypothetical protein N7532_011289 [Penicillium argentinense]|uniref:Uncharacterized protein n=1 Tax=Penicillium argentinense TaxID=1131581 RepID=A0A9W9JUU3_9EURO|nr:uncharacterized protein N7532_011289 [Penicillium argentinense]KAJ5082246.1 hypothetical protein N7532_011289 [Penicillium argentinense]